MNEIEQRNKKIDNLEAGPELDALVAEKVMGCNLIPHTNEKFGMTCGCRDKQHRHYEESLDDLLNAYSTDIAAAWKVVEKLQKEALIIVVDISDADPPIECCVETRGYSENNGARWVASAATAPLAICRASLKTVQNEKALASLTNRRSN